jgi:LacI family transcriptional regulator
MGIAAYMRVHNPWTVFHLERGLVESVPLLLQQHKFDGVIARIETEEVWRSIEKLSAPTVDLRGVFTPSHGVSFNTDPAACAAMAIEHFRERGLKRVAFCGYDGVDFSDKRRDAFVKLSVASNMQVEYFATQENSQSPQDVTILDTLQKELAGELVNESFDQWLDELPKPIGLWACNDIRARQVLASARRREIRVPDDVAILGVDDDEVICDLSHPPLSSIVPNTHRIGYEGAAQLASLMKGEVPDSRLQLIPPIRVAVRKSSDMYAVEDPEVAAALHFIREHGLGRVGVEDVVRATSISRTTLERRFREVVGRTPREEIERVRIQRVRTLLTDTTYSLEKIADLTGFGSPAHVVTAFRRHHRCTPGQYRSEQSPG